MKVIFVFVLASFAVIAFGQYSPETKIPRKIRKSPGLLAQYLTYGAKTQEEKTTKIYEYITSEIAYDYNSLLDSKPYAVDGSKDVLKSKLAIGLTYCYLMHDMLAAVKIKSVVVPGYTQGAFNDSLVVPYRHGYYWIAIQIDGEWKLADPTMDAGYIGKEKNQNEANLLKERGKAKAKFEKKNQKLNVKRESIMKLDKLQKVDKKLYKLKDSYQEKVADFDKEEEEGDFYKNSVGFVQKPTKDWFLIHPDSFLLAHLPLNPMWQLRSDTVGIIDFIKGEDSLNQRFEEKGTGGYDFDGTDRCLCRNA